MMLGHRPIASAPLAGYRVVVAAGGFFARYYYDMAA